MATYLPTEDLLEMECTCRFLHRIIKDFMIGQDVTSKTGDALFWACENDNAGLVKYILDKGASPHTFFCFCGRPGERETSKAKAEYAAKTGRPLLEPVCEHDSSRPHVMYPKNGELVEVSALVLATRSNSLAVMKILLDHGAHVIEKNGVVIPGNIMPWDARLFKHRSVLSHARSVEAAEMLVKADPDAINDPANTRYMPLEVILAQRLDDTPSDQDKKDLFNIVKFLVSKGALPRRQNCRNMLLNTTFTGGPLQLALAVNCEDIVKLLLVSDRVGTEDQSDESTEAFIRLISPVSANQRFGPAPGSESKGAVKYRYIESFVMAGFPLNKPLMAGIYPLTLAIQEREQPTVEQLVHLGADSNFTDAVNMHPLALSVSKTRNLWVRDAAELNLPRLQINPALLEVCNVDGRSFHGEGFTPLMFAASDMIKPECFKALIDNGADVSLTGRLFPSSPTMSLLQCVLQGFPRAQNEEQEELYTSLDLLLLRPSRIAMRIPAFRHYFATTSWERRSVKVGEFFLHAESPDDFYTPDGESILKWAIENLYSHDMRAVAEIATPICSMMKSPNDRAACLDALFSPSRCKDYLEFGTLDLTLQMAEILLAQGMPEIEPIQGDTLLHRVCSITPRLADESR